MPWIAAAVGVGGALLGGSQQAKAAKKAGQQYEAGVRRTEQNTGLRSTYSPGGAAAYNQALSLLGVNSPGNGSQKDYQAFFSGNQALQDEWKKNQKLRDLYGNDPLAYAKEHDRIYGGAPEVAGTGGNGPGGQAAFQNYLDSAGYKTQLNAGIDALNSNAAARGMLKSGATLKATQRFGSGLGQQYFNNYIGQLMNTANMGLSADQTLAGAYTGAAGGQAGAQLQAGQAIGGAVGDIAQNVAGAIALQNRPVANGQG